MEELTEVECLNDRCGKEFKTSAMKNVCEIVTCTHCGADHALDTDDIGKGEFWYLHSTKENK